MRCTYDTRSILKQIRQVLIYIYILVATVRVYMLRLCQDALEDLATILPSVCRSTNVRKLSAVVVIETDREGCDRICLSMCSKHCMSINSSHVPSPNPNQFRR
jgi:hypothetical protein